MIVQIKTIRVCPLDVTHATKLLTELAFASRAIEKNGPGRAGAARFLTAPAELGMPFVCLCTG